MDISGILGAHNPWWDDAGARPLRAARSQQRDAFTALWTHVTDREGARAAILVGPRQVGKTTLLLQLIDRALDEGWPPGNLTFFDFSDDRLVDTISPRAIIEARPRGLRGDRPRLFLLDEIQEAVQWQRWLKTAVDEARRTEPGVRPVFIATGSSAVTLSEGGVESGQGRWDEISIEGLTYAEYLKLSARLGEDPSDVLNREPGIFERYLVMGGFPEHVLTSRPLEALLRIRQDIVERAILRDLRRTGTDVDRVKRLFVYLVTDSGQIWNATDRSSDLRANPKSVDAWLEILEATHLVHRLADDRTQRGKAAAKLRAQPKIYAADHGLLTAMSYAPDPLDDSAIRGQVFEAVVFRHLRDVARRNGARLTYFRQPERGREGDLEIDFVLRIGRTKPIVIEVTNSKEVDGRKINRMRRAADVIEAGRRIVVTGGLTRGQHEDVRLIPIHEILREPDQVLEDT